MQTTVCDQYRDGKSIREIASNLGIAIYWVRKHLRDGGVSMRVRGVGSQKNVVRRNSVKVVIVCNRVPVVRRCVISDLDCCDECLESYRPHSSSSMIYREEDVLCMDV